MRCPHWRSVIPPPLQIGLLLVILTFLEVFYLLRAPTHTHIYIYIYYLFQIHNKRNVSVKIKTTNNFETEEVLAKLIIKFQPSLSILPA
jgi:hypothetical protein